MNSENYSDQPVLPEDESIQEDTPALPTTRKLRYKTVLIAVVIGIIAITVLLIISQVSSPPTDPLMTGLDSQAQTEYEVLGAVGKQQGEGYDAINGRLDTLASRIEQGFEIQKAEIIEVNLKLTAVDKSLQEIKTAVDSLGEGSKEINRLVSDAASRLDVVTKQVNALKASKRKPATKPKQAKTPPFHIDAIDVWDDESYVVVSQDGRVAFLKVGERQSGWNVTQIDRLKGQVRFKGPSGQIHSVELQR